MIIFTYFGLYVKSLIIYTCALRYN